MGNAPAHDLAFVSRVLRGDALAAEAMVERLRPLVTAVVRRRVPARTDEVDLIQSVFLRVFAKLDQYSGKAPLEHWVSRIAISTCANEFRYERKRPELRRADLSVEQDEVLDHLNKSDAELSPQRQVAARELVNKLLERLSPKEHLVITMLYIEGRTLQEIHSSTGWSVLAAKLLAFRARNKMKKALKHLLWEGPP